MRFQAAAGDEFRPLAGREQVDGRGEELSRLYARIDELLRIGRDPILAWRWSHPIRKLDRRCRRRAWIGTWSPWLAGLLSRLPDELEEGVCEHCRTASSETDAEFCARHQETIGCIVTRNAELYRAMRSTLAAAVTDGHVGVELNEGYCEIAERRVQAAKDERDYGTTGRSGAGSGGRGVTRHEVRRAKKSIRRAFEKLQAAGYELHAMDDTLLLLDPEGVKVVGDGCLADSDIHSHDHMESICYIDGAGGW